MTQDELKIIIEKHGKWLRNEDGEEKADLTGADLTGANLTWADLTGANLTGANLTGADLTGADLTWADLTGANLTGANLTGANLTGANLTGANLTGANLTGANLIVIHPGPWTMIVTKTHVHVGCERFLNDKSAEAAMRMLAKKHKAQDFLRLYIESLRAANKLMKLSAVAANKKK
jgi:hypothetical protein